MGCDILSGRPAISQGVDDNRVTESEASSFIRGAP